MSLHCVVWNIMSCSDQALPKHCIPCEHVWGKNKNQGLALLTMFYCSGVTAPGVDNNGVILLSAPAASPSQIIFLLLWCIICYWAGTLLNVFPIEFWVWLSLDYRGGNGNFHAIVLWEQSSSMYVVQHPSKKINHLNVFNIYERNHVLVLSLSFLFKHTVK